MTPEMQTATAGKQTSGFGRKELPRAVGRLAPAGAGRKKILSFMRLLCIFAAILFFHSVVHATGNAISYGSP
jgi:hypothetical protein